MLREPQQAREQTARLSAISVFGNREINHNQCPVCESKLSTSTPSAEALREALAQMSTRISGVQRERPRVEKHLQNSGMNSN